MFGYGMGVEGAAIATVLSQAVVSVWLLLYYLKGKGTVISDHKLSNQIFKSLGK
jgi:Na+-driven multidrug efflux pump